MPLTPLARPKELEATSSIKPRSPILRLTFLRIPKDSLVSLPCPRKPVSTSEPTSRPLRIVQAIHSYVAEVRRRLSTSAIDTKCEHSHSIVQTPHCCGRQRPFSGSRRPRVHEPGAGVANHARPSFAAITREQTLYPNPFPSSTSCHYRVSAEGRNAHNEDAPSIEPIHTAAWVVFIHPFRTRLTPLSREEKKRSNAPEVLSFDVPILERTSLPFLRTPKPGHKRT